MDNGQDKYNHCFVLCCQQPSVGTPMAVIVSDARFVELFPSDPNDCEAPTADLCVMYNNCCYCGHSCVLNPTNVDGLLVTASPSTTCPSCDDSGCYNEIANSGKYSRRIASSLYSQTAYSEVSPVSLLIPGKQAATFNDWRSGVIASSWDAGAWYTGRYTTKYSATGYPWRNWFVFAVGAVTYNISSLANRELIGLRLRSTFTLYNYLWYSCASNCFNQSFEMAVANFSGNINDYSIQNALDMGTVVGRVVNYDVTNGVFPFNITSVNTDAFGDNIIVFMRLTNYLDDNQCYLDHDECAYGYPAIGGNYNYAGSTIYLQHRAGT